MRTLIKKATQTMLSLGIAGILLATVGIVWCAFHAIQHLSTLVARLEPDGPGPSARRKCASNGSRRDAPPRGRARPEGDAGAAPAAVPMEANRE